MRSLTPYDVGAPLEMNVGTKSGVCTISLGRLQCIRRDSTGPTDRQTEEEEEKEQNSAPNEELSSI
jgi:hypothetical protein